MVEFVCLGLVERRARCDHVRLLSHLFILNLKASSASPQRKTNHLHFVLHNLHLYFIVSGYLVSDCQLPAPILKFCNCDYSHS